MSELTNNFAFDVDAVVFNPVDENVQAEAGGSAAPRLPSFTAVAYTGGAMVPQNFPHPVAIDLDGLSCGRSKFRSGSFTTASRGSATPFAQSRSTAPL